MNDDNYRPTNIKPVRSPNGRPTGDYTYTAVRVKPKIGRNEPCPCGSGKKYKKCCIDAPPVEGVKMEEEEIT